MAIHIESMKPTLRFRLLNAVKVVVTFITVFVIGSSILALSYFAARGIAYAISGILQIVTG